MERSSINHSFQLRDKGLSTAVDGTGQPRHRWYHVKESFSPTLLRTAISNADCSAGDVIVDPFCGSGTAPVVGAELGLTAYGIEVNPFLAFVAATKLLSPSKRECEAALSQAYEGTQKPLRSELERFSTFSYSPGLKKWLFNRGVLRSFEGGWALSNNLEPQTRSLIRLALLGAAMDTCNATRDGKCLRYRSDWKERSFDAADFRHAFLTRAAQMIEDLDRPLPHGRNSKVTLGDSRVALESKLPSHFRVCVTSPPYLNSFDYTDIYRPELFLGRFVHSMSELRALRLRTLRSHVQVDWERPTRVLPSLLARQCSAKIRKAKESLWDSRIPDMITAYFEDMSSVLSSLRRRAAKHAVLWVVVSTSAYASVEVPVDLILAELGVAAGWRLSEIGVLRQLRSSGQHWATLNNAGTPPLRESVVILTTSTAKGTVRVV